MKIWLLIYLIILAGVAHGQYQMRFSVSYYLPENWPKVTFNVSVNSNLGDLFDAGIRPHYAQGFESQWVEVKHVRLQVVQADGVVLPEFPVEYSQVRVKPAGISEMMLFGQPISTDEAQVVMTKWTVNFSEERKKPSSSLKRFLKSVEADYSGYDDPDFGGAPGGFGGGWEDSMGVQYGVRFQKTFNEVLPLRMCFTISWYNIMPREDSREFFDGAIPVPEGHEGGGMKTEHNFGPDDVAEMMYAKRIKFPDGHGLGGRHSNVIEKEEGVMQLSRSDKKFGWGDQAVEDGKEIEEETGVGIWIGLGIAGLALILVYAILRIVRKLGSRDSAG